MKKTQSEELEVMGKKEMKMRKAKMIMMRYMRKRMKTEITNDRKNIKMKKRFMKIQNQQKK